MDIAEETNTLEQKILEVLREEIGVEIGEEFDVYDKGDKQWTCKFEGDEFFHKIDDEFYKSGVWRDIVYGFPLYTFKRKRFIPKKGEGYFTLAGSQDEDGNIKIIVLNETWADLPQEYAMTAIENVYRSRKEALANKDKLAEKLEKLRKGE